MEVLARHLGNAPEEWLLTYVNELLTIHPDQRGVGDLKEHIADTLAEARQWLRNDELPKLELQLAELLK
jgi:hypothetical protein